MKRLLFTFCILLPSGVISGQLQNERIYQPFSETIHSAGDISVSISPNVLFNTPNGTQLAGGFKLRMFISKRFSFDSDLVLGRDYTHFGIGLIGLPIWFFVFRPNENLFNTEDYTISELLGLGLIMLLSAEHTGYHIPVNNYTDISPYVSPLRLKIDYGHGYSDNPDISRDQILFVIGLEVNKYFKRFILSPYVEYNIGYSDHISGFNTGVYCGYYFPRKY